MYIVIHIMACQTLLITSSLLSQFPAAAEPESERAVVFPAGSVLRHRVVRMQRTRGLCASQNADEHVLYILPRGWVRQGRRPAGLSKHFGSSIVSKQLPDDVSFMTFICCSLMIDALDKHHGDIISLRGVCHYHGLLPSHLSDCFAHWYYVCIVYWILLNLSTNYEQSQLCVFANLRVLIHVHVDLHVSVSELPIGRTLLVFQLITQLDHRISITCTATWKTSPSGRA